MGHPWVTTTHRNRVVHVMTKQGLICHSRQTDISTCHPLNIHMDRPNRRLCSHLPVNRSMSTEISKSCYISLENVGSTSAIHTTHYKVGHTSLSPLQQYPPPPPPPPPNNNIPLPLTVSLTSNMIKQYMNTAISHYLPSHLHMSPHPRPPVYPQSLPLAPRQSASR